MSVSGSVFCRNGQNEREIYINKGEISLTEAEK